jgi:hypothetical protein
MAKAIIFQQNADTPSRAGVRELEEIRRALTSYFKLPLALPFAAPRKRQARILDRRPSDTTEHALAALSAKRQPHYKSQRAQIAQCQMPRPSQFALTIATSRPGNPFPL